MYHGILLVGSDAGEQKILRMNVAILLKPINRMFRNEMTFLLRSFGPCFL